MSRKDIAFSKREVKKYKKAYKTELRKIKNKIFNKNNTTHTEENPIYQEIDQSLKWINKDEKIHRDKKPALIYKNGAHYWFKNGICHNENKPAIVGTEGYKWAIYGQYHNEEKPAIVWAGKSKAEYWKHKDRNHRINGFSHINLTPQEFEIESEKRNINCHNEIYILFVDNIQYFNEKDYVKACKEWILKNKTAHACLEIFEELDKNLKEGKFNKNNWHKNQFKSQGKYHES